MSRRERFSGGAAAHVVASLVACHVPALVHPVVSAARPDRDGNACHVQGDPNRVVGTGRNQPFLHCSSWHAMSYRSHHFTFDYAPRESLDPFVWTMYTISAAYMV